MQILALVRDPAHVCCRYRLAAYAPYFRAAGHRLDIQSWSRFSVFSRRFLSALRRADVVVIQRILMSGWHLSWLRRRTPYLVYDFDDALFLRDSHAPKGPHCPRRLQRFRHTIQQVDAVIAGNAYLRDQAAAFTDPRRIHVIPTCVDFSRYRSASHGLQRERRLVWIGSSSTLASLARIGPWLEALANRVPNLALKIICDRSLALQHLPVEFSPWSQEREAEELATADIGISWLPDDDWSRGKCGLKILQYYAAGLPVVANPVGVHREMIRQHVTGYLASSGAEWLHAIARLAEDAALRRRLGGAGCAFVERQYSCCQGAARWSSLLDRVPADSRQRSPLCL